MPDVSRSDSQRSDTSNRPRVSFNRDVHVKRIVSHDSAPVTGALSGDGAGHLVALPVRKERLGGLTKKQLAEEASKVLNQADKVDCTTNKGKPPDKFYTLPTRKKHRKSESPHSSQERLTTRRRSEELGALPAPPKPPRTFTTSTPKKDSLNKGTKQKNSLLRLFAKSESNSKSNEPKKSNLKRSVSDASNLKSNSKTEQKSNRKRSGSESEDNPNNSSTKKTQLSPIIEVSTPKDDYFSVKKDYFSNKENVDDFFQEKNDINVNKKTPRKKWDKSPINKNKGLQEKHENKDTPEIVYIDVEKAESINDNKKKKLSSNSFKNKFKFLSSLSKDKTKHEQDSKKTKGSIIKEEEIFDEVDNSQFSSLTIEPPPLHLPESKTSPKIQEAIKILEGSLDKSSDMIHSSQLPAEKIPLTRGHTVDTMIKRLSRDKYSPPPKTNTILVTPTVTVAHNNNQPFSYTQPRGHSPERPYSRSKSPERPYSRSKSPERPYSRSKSPDRPYTRSKSPLFDKPSSPVIYAQVVCGETDGLGSNKKTVHTAYSTNKSKFQHSDSDEGLGYEENHGFSNRKYTQFGDEKKFEIDKFDEEYPITPKFKSFGSSNNGYDNYEYSKTEHHTSYIDSSARGRGDGMDSRRRESLTEPLIENGINVKFNDNFHNGKSDLSHRRDLLESRINSRRLADKFANHSPELYTPKANKFVSESTSRYYRHGSSSPVGFTDNYRSETKVDRNGEKYVTESRSRIVQGDQIERNNYHNRYDRYDQEPKSVDSQISDYRSSPENATRKYYASHEASKDYRSLHSNKYKAKGDKLSKDRDHYKSNPEIINRNYDSSSYMYDNSETYHDSLRRQKYDIRKEDVKHSDKYFDNGERIDKFGDSGIENDFRRDSGENVRITSRTYTQTCRSNNESEDEGFASSLLIASERQHTEDNFTNRKFRKDYDSDKDIRRNGEIIKTKHEYVHRERSIDDGSHYDPRIDKDLDDKRGSLKMDSKPPKPAKMSSLKKVKQLFTRDSNKKVKKDKLETPRLVREESLRARYKVYTGNGEVINRSTLKKETSDHRREYNSDSKIDNHSDNSQIYDYSNRRRLSTPNSSPRQMRESANHVQSGKQQDSWFKSLDRFSLKKNKNLKNDLKEKPKVDSPKATPAKNLRFFGDTDQDSDTSVRRKSSLKTRSNIPTNYKSPAAPKTRSQSTRNLHNISEEFNHPDADALRYKSHKSMQNICESDRETRGSKSNLKPPISPTRKMETLKTKTDSRNRKRRNDISSVESSTEGDSSQQSQKSVVYLHAATVGDIPGPGYLARNGRRAASKEDLISNGSSRMQPQVKTLSRSFSVLAPWKPRYAHEGLDIDYSPQARPVRHMKNGSSKSGGKTAKEISNQKKMSNQNLSTLNRKSKSKENVSNSTLNKRAKDEASSKSSNNTTTLYKKKERSPKENMRYSRDDKKIASKTMSVESLGGGSRSSLRSKEDSRNVSRSISMPRDPEKSAGWFNKINKKNSKKNLSSSQRL